MNTQNAEKHKKCTQKNQNGVSLYLPQGIYGARLLFFVSARTNKRHHHHKTLVYMCINVFER
jgi:hypothetical protein